MIVITGATGLLGSELLSQLHTSTDIAIRCIYNRTPPDFFLNSSRVEWVQCDLLNYDCLFEVLQDAKFIYHCAAMVSFDNKGAEVMMHNNIESTSNLVNIAKEIGVHKFLFVSSVATLGRHGLQLSGELISEKNLWANNSNNSIYSISKHRAEMEVWRAGAEGLNTVIVNPSVILGEGNFEKSSGTLFKHVYKEFPFYTIGINGFVDVKDVVRSMIILMESDVINERFIINCDNYSYKDIFTMIALAMHKKPPRYYANKLLSGIAWRYFYVRHLLTGKKSLITKSSARVANDFYRYNNTKFLKLFPNFKYTPIRETIQRISDLYIKN